jgi:hypothetical protein
LPLPLHIEAVLAKRYLDDLAITLMESCTFQVCAPARAFFRQTDRIDELLDLRRLIDGNGADRSFGIDSLGQFDFGSAGESLSARLWRTGTKRREEENTALDHV